MIWTPKQFAVKTAVPNADLETGIVPRHRSAARILAPALGANVPEGWRHCADHWVENLTPGEIFGIAFAGLDALAPVSREAAFHLAQYGQTEPRMPMPTWGNPMDDARSWVRFASLRERKAFGLVCFESFPPKARVGFLAYVAKELT